MPQFFLQLNYLKIYSASFCSNTWKRYTENEAFGVPGRFPAWTYIMQSLWADKNAYEKNLSHLPRKLCFKHTRYLHVSVTYKTGYQLLLVRQRSNSLAWQALCLQVLPTGLSADGIKGRPCSPPAPGSEKDVCRQRTEKDLENLGDYSLLSREQ